MSPRYEGAAAFALSCKSGRSFFCCLIEQRRIMAPVAKDWLAYIAKYP